MPRELSRSGTHASDLSRSRITDLSPVMGHPTPGRVDPDGTSGPFDIRPPVGLPGYGQWAPGRKPSSCGLQGCGACIDPAISVAAEIENPDERIQAFLAHLRTFPPGPNRCPRRPAPRSRSPIGGCR